MRNTPETETKRNLFWPRTVEAAIMRLLPTVKRAGRQTHPQHGVPGGRTEADRTGRDIERNELVGVLAAVVTSLQPIYKERTRHENYAQCGVLGEQRK